MNQKSKITGLIAAALIFISLGSAEVALTVPQSSQEIEGLETGYRIGLINTGGEERNVSFTVDSPEALEVSMPDAISLPPSDLSSSPNGDSWYQAAPGRYVKIEYVKLNTSIDAQVAEKRRFNFSVLASTTRETSISRPEVSSINQLDFALYSGSSEIDTGFDGSLWEDSEKDSDEESRQNRSEEESEVSESEIDDSPQRPDNSTSNIDGREDSSGPESVTIILLLGIFLTAGYVLLEVML